MGTMQVCTSAGLHCNADEAGDGAGATIYGGCGTELYCSSALQQGCAAAQMKPETALVRPFIVGAVLRGVTFTPTRYASFIDLQVHPVT